MAAPRTPIRQTVLRPLGLRTTPNPYGQYPAGALSNAANCVMRRPGELMAAPSRTNVTTPASMATTDATRLLAPLDAGHVYSFIDVASSANWAVQEGVIGGTQTDVNLPPLTTVFDLFSPSRVNWTRSRERMIVNARRGNLVSDSMAPTNATQRALRWAGMTQVLMTLTTSSTATGNPIPDGVTVGYVAIAVRKTSDGYTVKGVPSCPIRFHNGNGGAVYNDMFVLWDQNRANFAVGDIIEFYRTDGLVTTSFSADPGNTFKLIKSAVLTSTDITNNYVTVRDDQGLTAPYYTTSGRELYTNPYQEGSNKANRQPDICQALATFQGFTFYGNLTERAQLELTAPAGFIYPDGGTFTDYARTRGIGTRNASCTFTNGSPTVTGVSASQMLGIVPGQMWTGDTHFSYGVTKVLSVGASTITFTTNAVGSGAGTAFVSDVIELNGGTFTIAGVGGLLIGLSSFFEVTSSAFVPSQARPTDGPLTLILEYLRVYGDTPTGSQSITARATNGQNYSPALPQITGSVATYSPTTTANLMRWSKDSEPEHVPAVYETQVGSGSIIAMCPTKDALWIACTDAIYRLSGEAGNWRVDIVAPETVLCSPRSMINMREQVYAYTNFGFGAVTDSGFVPISQSVVRTQFPGPPFSESVEIFLGGQELEGEVLVSQTIGASTALYIYNTITDAFTYLSGTPFNNVSAFAWQESPASGNQALLVATTDSGVGPVWWQWNSTTAHLDMTVSFTPWFGEEPNGVKQWIDVTYLFLREASGYSLWPGYAGTFNPSTIPISVAQGGTEAQCTTGVPRQYAISPRISPSFSISNIASNRVFLYGVSVRYVPLTTQAALRQ